MPKGAKRVSSKRLLRLAGRFPDDKVQLSEGHILVKLLSKRDGQKYESIVLFRTEKRACFQGDIKVIKGSIVDLGHGWKDVTGVIYFIGPNQVRDSVFDIKKWTA